MTALTLMAAIAAGVLLAIAVFLGLALVLTNWIEAINGDSE